MEVSEFRAELEAENAWRADDIRFLWNQGAKLVEADQKLFLRAVVVMLYAHLEGFTKFAFLHYIAAINQLGIRCDQANAALAAASLSDILAALRDPHKKCDEFRNELPDDVKLHLFAREREFVQRLDGVMNRTLVVSDDVIDTESNLKPIVIKKLLFRIGLPHNALAVHEGKINKLLNYRNNIAHGDSKNGIDVSDYEDLQKTTFEVMSEISRQLTDALDKQRYLRIAI